MLEKGVEREKGVQDVELDREILYERRRLDVSQATGVAYSMSDFPKKLPYFVAPCRYICVE